MNESNTNLSDAEHNIVNGLKPMSVIIYVAVGVFLAIVCSVLVLIAL